MTKKRILSFFFLLGASGFCFAEPESAVDKKSKSTVTEHRSPTSPFSEKAPLETEQEQEPEAASTTADVSLINNPRWRRLKQTEDWVEDQINPTSQSIEDFFQPLIQWTENKIHAIGGTKWEKNSSPNIKLLAPKNSVPAHSNADDQLISQHQAVNSALLHREGKALSAELISTTTPYYRIKILTPNAQVEMIYVDAITADIISQPTDTEDQP